MDDLMNMRDTAATLQAKRAIDALHGDTSVTPEATLEMLVRVQIHVGELIDCMREDLDL